MTKLYLELNNMQIKDLKVGDVIKNKDAYFCKVLDKTDNLVALSYAWRVNSVDKEKNSSSCSCYATEYELKEHTLVTPEWKASELKVGDIYFYITNYGSSANVPWNNDKYDIFRLKAGLIYQTKELAQKAIEEINNK